jgi:hypothetical protein
VQVLSRFPQTSYWLVGANETVTVKNILIIVNSSRDNSHSPSWRLSTADTHAIRNACAPRGSIVACLWHFLRGKRFINHHRGCFPP